MYIFSKELTVYSVITIPRLSITSLPATSRLYYLGVIFRCNDYCAIEQIVILFYSTITNYNNNNHVTEQINFPNWKSFSSSRVKDYCLIIRLKQSV